MKPENIRRARIAKRALIYFYGEKEYSRAQTKLEGFETVLRDMLTDLYHFCEMEEIDFSEQARVAYDHYCAERNGVI